ncbi:MAG TPA: hypothetical protein VK507_25285 [Iamia sp.]|nr:hypothetical protein [Iamia sp.]
MPFGKRRATKAPEGRIQVTTYSGRPIVDPPADVIRDLVLNIVDDPDEFVIVALGADPGGTYVQVAYLSDGRWMVESRDGSEESHAHAFVPDVHAAAAVLALWTADDPAWRTVAPWQAGFFG